MENIVNLRIKSERIPNVRYTIANMTKKILDISTNYNIIDNQFLVERLQEMSTSLASIIIEYRDLAWNIKYYINRILADDYIPDYMKPIFNCIDQNRIDECIGGFRIASHMDIVPGDMSKELEQRRNIIDSVRNSYDKLLQISNEILGVIERSRS